MKYKVKDRVLLKVPHSEGNEVTILEVLEDKYKIYIPYWAHFYIEEDQIIGLAEFQFDRDN